MDTYSGEGKGFFRCLHLLNAGCIYPISVFTKASIVKTTSDVQVNITGHAPLANLAELDQWHVPDRIKVIIEEGDHPHEKPKAGKDSRSEWLFDVVCELVRYNVPDNLIYGIITDSAWPISASVLDKGAKIHDYAIRQIKRAKEFTIDPRLLEMNDNHAVIEEFGGKCVVMSEIYDPSLDRVRTVFQAIHEFQQRYSNRKVQVGIRANGSPQMSFLLDDQVFSDCNLASLIFKALHSSEIHL